MRRIMMASATLSLLMLTGCAGTIELQSEMSNHVVLNPQILKSSKTVYVHINNRTSFQDNDLGQLVKDKITNTGRTVTTNPEDADYQLHVDMIYLGEQKKDITMARSVSGGFGSLLAGCGLSGQEGLTGHYVGMIDVLIKENPKSDALSVLDRQSAPMFQKYRTRNGVEVVQGNANHSKAVKAINDRLASQVAEYFKNTL